MTASVFEGLNVINHCFAKADKIRKSWLIMPSMSVNEEQA